MNVIQLTYKLRTSHINKCTKLCNKSQHPNMILKNNLLAKLGIKVNILNTIKPQAKIRLWFERIIVNVKTKHPDYYLLCKNKNLWGLRDKPIGHWNKIEGPERTQAHGTLGWHRAAPSVSGEVMGHRCQCICLPGWNYYILTFHHPQKEIQSWL